jgi:predicted ATPase
MEKDLQLLGIPANDIITFSFNSEPIQARLQSESRQREMADLELSPENAHGVAMRHAEALKSLAHLKERLSEPARLHQAYLSALKSWEDRKSAIEGDATTPGTIAYYNQLLAELVGIPQKIADNEAIRSTIVEELFAEIKALADYYAALYEPVQKYISANPQLEGEQFKLTFEVAIREDGLQEQLFQIISHAAAGSFCGRMEGLSRFKELAGRAHFDSATNAAAFVESVIAALKRDLRQKASPAVEIRSQLRKEKSVEEVYDLLYSLKYLEPRYTLRLNGKDVSQLSPGEKGALLLVFYLLIDESDIPLVIDQPEENLDNQTIFSLLVPTIKRASRRRQIIMVTHNPNLAVVCDADQVICAQMDASGSQIRYFSGAIESPDINTKLLDILEGTRQAFDNRDRKYGMVAAAGTPAGTKVLNDTSRIVRYLSESPPEVPEVS